MQKKTLRIKRIFMDQIISGEKKFEYRACKKYYAWLENIEVPFILNLHSQKNDLQSFIVTKVSKIKKPSWIRKEFVATKLCWKLKINFIPSK